MTKKKCDEPGLSIEDAKNHKKITIKSLANKWMINQFGKLLTPVHASKYYVQSESWTKKPAWAVQFSRDEVWSGNHKYVNWLLQKEPGAPDFYHLKVPTSYVQEHDTLLGRNNEMFSLFLSAQEHNLFHDERGPGKVSFARYLEDRERE